MNRAAPWTLCLGVIFLSAEPVTLTISHPASARPMLIQDSDDVEDDIEDDVEDDIEDDVEDDIEDDVEDDIENDVEDDIEDDVEDDIEDDVEDDIEDDVEDDIEKDVEDDIEDDVEDDIEDDVEDDIEDDVEDDIEDDVEDDIEDDVDDDVDHNSRIGRQRSSRFGNRRSARRSIDRDLIDIERIDRGIEAIADERLVLLAPENFDALIASDVNVIRSFTLRAMDLVVAKIETPPDRDLEEIDSLVLSVVPDADIDRNHVYRFQAMTSSVPTPRLKPSPEQARQGVSVPKGIVPASFLPSTMPAPGPPRALKIGQIDTQIWTDHPALRGRGIRQVNFVSDADVDVATLPMEHGTAIASILVGRYGAFGGISPGAPLHAASVFLVHPKKGPYASAENLVRAMDWMISEKVDIVNMSLAGPPNQIVQTAVQRMIDAGIVVVAAVGNKGPGGAPQYPSAYPDVIGVTAVDRRNRVYRRSSRGDHVDVASPGVDIVVASPEGGFHTLSGTSMAVPFAVGAIHSVCSGKSRCRNEDDAIRRLGPYLQDNGESGRDEIYGLGIIDLSGGDATQQRVADSKP